MYYVRILNVMCAQQWKKKNIQIRIPPKYPDPQLWTGESFFFFLANFLVYKIGFLFKIFLGRQTDLILDLDPMKIFVSADLQ